MLPSGFVLAYHGCDREIGERVLAGKAEIQVSTNDYDWLGSGAYFWEGDSQRALEWARFLQERPASSRGSVREPFAIGAVILPGLCLDLTEADSLKLVAIAYRQYEHLASLLDTPVPKNLPGSEGDADLVKRHLDCAVFNFLHEHRAGADEPPFDTVRCPFFEGQPIFPGSKIAARTHLQWCVRNPSKSIIGYFRIR